MIARNAVYTADRAVGVQRKGQLGRVRRRTQGNIGRRSQRILHRHCMTCGIKVENMQLIIAQNLPVVAHIVAGKCPFAGKGVAGVRIEQRLVLGAHDVSGAGRAVLDSPGQAQHRSDPGGGNQHRCLPIIRICDAAYIYKRFSRSLPYQVADTRLQSGVHGVIQREVVQLAVSPLLHAAHSAAQGAGEAAARKGIRHRHAPAYRHNGAIRHRADNAAIASCRQGIKCKGRSLAACKCHSIFTRNQAEIAAHTVVCRAGSVEGGAGHGHIGEVRRFLGGKAAYKAAYIAAFFKYIILKRKTAHRSRRGLSHRAPQHRQGSRRGKGTI